MKRFLDHVVVEETKEVYFRGDYPTCMGIPHFMKQHYPGYTSHIVDINRLKEIRAQQ